MGNHSNESGGLFSKFGGASPKRIRIALLMGFPVAVGAAVVSYSAGASGASWAVVMVLLIVLVALGFWAMDPHQDLKDHRYALGSSKQVNITGFRANDEGSSAENCLAIVVCDVNSGENVTLENVFVPLAHMKCVRLGASLEVQVSASDATDMRIDWMATEHVQAQALAQASGYTVVYCAHCGAPLRPESAAQSTPCDYCGELNIPVKS